MEDKDPWSEAARTYANLLPSARYLTKAVLDQREDADNRRWLRSSPISVPVARPVPAAANSDSDLDDGEEAGGLLTGRVIARYSPDSAGRLRIEFGFLPEWAFTSTANTEAAVERHGEQLLPRSRYLSAALIANRRGDWLRSSSVQIPAAPPPPPDRLTVNITSPALEFEQRETIAGTRIGTIAGPLSDQLDPITITGTPPGLTIRVTDAGANLRRLILSGTVGADADARTYGVRVTASPPDDGDAVSGMLTIRIRTGTGDQELTWNDYSPDTERIGGRVTFRAPRVLEGPSRPSWSYSSDTPRICTVNSRTGALTLVAVGQCQVTATSAAAEGFREGTVQNIVTVTDKPVPEIRWQGYDSAEAEVGEPSPGVRRPTATVDGRSVRLTFTFEVDEDSERDGICDVNTRGGQLNALAAGTCIVIAKSAETDEYAAAESDPVRIEITKEKVDPDLRWDGYDAENLRVGDDPIDPREPQPRLREARGNLTYSYGTTTRSVCSVNQSTGSLTPRGRGSCEVTVMSEETDDFLADEETVVVVVLGERERPDLDWFDYQDSPTAGGQAVEPTRPSSRDRVGPLTYRSETPNVCSIDSRSGRLSGREEGTCRATVTSEETDDLYEGSETIPVRVGGKPQPQPCDLSYSGDVNVGEQIESRIDCGDGDGRARYETETSRFCAVNPNSGDVTGLERGQCRITATVPETSRYAQATARATLTVISNPPPQCDDIADVGPLDPGESGRSIGLNSYCWDPDGERLTYDAQSSDTNVATVRISGDSLTVTAARDGDGSATISVTATDPANQNARISFRVTVEGNEAPVCQSVSDVTINENDSETVTIRCSDGDGDRITLSPESSNRRIATASVSGSRITVRGESAGTATITVTADDGSGGTDSVRFGVTVERDNIPPERVGSISSITMDEGNSETIAVSSYFRDRDGDRLSYSATSSSSRNVSVSVSGSSVTVEGLREGSSTITVTADDGNGGTETQVFTVTVNTPPQVNQAPTCDTIPKQFFSFSSSNSNPSRYINYDSYCTDPDGDPLTIQTTSSNGYVAYGSNSSSAGRTNLLIAAVDIGTATITVNATDPGGLSATTSFEIKAGNHAPVWNCDPLPRVYITGGNESTTEIVDVASCFSDPEGGRMQFYTSDRGDSIRVSEIGSRFTVFPYTTGGARSFVEITAQDDGDVGDGRTRDRLKSTAIRWPVTVLQLPSSRYARCDPDKIKVYYFNTQSWTKHHLDITGDEATSIFGRRWWDRIDRLSKRSCGYWPTGTSYGTSETRALR